MMKFAQALRRLRSEEKGFTLVELMVVVVIIGVLAAVAIPKFAGIIDNSKQKADIATGKTIKDSVDRFYVDKGAYPTDILDLTTAIAPLQPYLNNSPKVAQGDGSLSATSTAFANPRPATNVYNIDSATGQVTVHKVVDNAVTADIAWDSNN
jgi:type II secretion system protein G